MKIVYKVFSESPSGELLSSWARGAACKVYRAGRWNYAPRWLASRGYHLTCFESLEAINSACMAIRCAQGSIWLCEASPFRKYPPMLHNSFLFSHRMIISNNCWPMGTKMVTRLKPLERLSEITNGAVCI